MSTSTRVLMVDSHDTLSRLLNTEALARLDVVMLTGNRKPGDPTPPRLLACTATRSRPFDDSEVERARWNAEVDRRKAERKQK